KELHLGPFEAPLARSDRLLRHLEPLRPERDELQHVARQLRRRDGQINDGAIGLLHPDALPPGIGKSDKSHGARTIANRPVHDNDRLSQWNSNLRLSSPSKFSDSGAWSGTP